ncbi:hypothetical protein MTO96_016732 [Rhipicephalus appendiculatus]
MFMHVAVKVRLGCMIIRPSRGPAHLKERAGTATGPGSFQRGSDAAAYPGGKWNQRQCFRGANEGSLQQPTDRRWDCPSGRTSVPRREWRSLIELGHSSRLTEGHIQGPTRNAPCALRAGGQPPRDADPVLGLTAQPLCALAAAALIVSSL